MKKNTYIVPIVLAFLTPTVSFAALNGLKGLLCSFIGILNALIPIVYGLSLIYFLWGGAQFILHAGDVKLREEGRNRMIWGIVALFVMLSINGILYWLSSTIDIPLPTASSQVGYCR